MEGYPLVSSQPITVEVVVMARINGWLSTRNKWVGAPVSKLSRALVITEMRDQTSKSYNSNFHLLRPLKIPRNLTSV